MKSSNQVGDHIDSCWRCWLTCNLDLPRRKFLCNVMLEILAHKGINP